jgi:hypothetical protein
MNKNFTNASFEYLNLLGWVVYVACRYRHIVIIFLHGLGGLTCSGIDALSSFPRSSTIWSSKNVVFGDGLVTLPRKTKYS